jgi:UDP-glucose 4-epimerase
MADKQNTLLITGGLGFIGCALCARLLKDKPEWQIKILDNYSLGTLEDMADATGQTIGKDNTDALASVGPIQIITGDIRNRDDLEHAMQNATHVVHLAAQTSVPVSTENPLLDFETNVTPLFNLLDIARISGNKPKIVFSSSNAPLGRAVQPVSEASLPSPIAPYGASKLVGETYLSTFGQAYGIPSVSLRFGNVYGPGSVNKTSVVAKFIKQALNGETLEIYGDGSATRDFIHIDDLISALVKALELEIDGNELFQISHGTETTIGALTDSICDAFVERGLPRPNVQFGEERAGDMPRNVSDVSKARDVLGWTTQKPLISGILETLDWFLARR